MTTHTLTDEEQLIATLRLTRDLRTAAATLESGEARYLVDTYYALQKLRIGATAQVRSSTLEPNSLLSWTGQMYAQLETDVQQALLAYAKSSLVGRWSLSIIGIGPVIAAGLLAHIDIEQAPTVGHIWRYAGLDPTSKWEKKTKRPWNAALKVISWKIGQSFMKTCNNEKSVYGALYKQRKAYEQEHNEQGRYSEQAARILKEKHIGKDTEAYAAYSQGKLPPAHIQQRSERYATKIFLSHFHAVTYEVHYGKPAPTPWVIQFGGHTDVLSVPNWPMIE